MNITLTAQSNWVKYIQQIVHKLNTRFHRTIHMSPLDAYLPENQSKLKKIYEINNTRKKVTPKLKVNAQKCIRWMK